MDCIFFGKDKPGRIMTKKTVQDSIKDLKTKLKQKNDDQTDLYWKDDLLSRFDAIFSLHP